MYLNTTSFNAPMNPMMSGMNGFSPMGNMGGGMSMPMMAMEQQLMTMMMSMLSSVFQGGFGVHWSLSGGGTAEGDEGNEGGGQQGEAGAH